MTVREDTLALLREWIEATRYSYQAGTYPDDVSPALHRILLGDGGLLLALSALSEAVYYGPDDTAATVASVLTIHNPEPPKQTPVLDDSTVIWRDPRGRTRTGEVTFRGSDGSVTAAVKDRGHTTYVVVKKSWIVE